LQKARAGLAASVLEVGTAGLYRRLDFIEPQRRVIAAANMPPVRCARGRIEDALFFYVKFQIKRDNEAGQDEKSCGFHRVHDFGGPLAEKSIPAPGACKLSPLDDPSLADHKSIIAENPSKALIFEKFPFFRAPSRTPGKKAKA
jgi:hypothetical protein